MFARLLILFTVVPLIELALLIKLGQLTSVSTTIAIVILTGILGAYLARREGLKTWRRVEQSLRQGISPADELVDALLILIAGVVLVTPGLLTDLLGFSLLIAPLRRWFKRRISRYFQRRMIVFHHGPITNDRDFDVIDVPHDP